MTIVAIVAHRCRRRVRNAVYAMGPRGPKGAPSPVVTDAVEMTRPNPLQNAHWGSVTAHEDADVGLEHPKAAEDTTVELPIEIDGVDLGMIER